MAHFVAAGAAVDLLELTRALVDVESVSYAEGGLADRIEADLRALPHLSVTRVGDNVVARTVGDRSTRLILAGHTDTVPVNRNFPATLDGDVVAVAHGGVARALFALIGGVAAERAPRMEIWQGRVIVFENGGYHWL